MKRTSLTLVLLAVSALPSSVRAHYCSNIFTGPARLVIQPEQSQLQVVAGTEVPLKVYLQNNFPYKLYGTAMRGVADGYGISVTPAEQDVGPGQRVLYTFKVTAPSSSEVQVSALELQVRFRVDDFRGDDDVLVNQSPSETTLVDRASGNGGEQAPALSAASLINRYPGATLPAGAPYFGRTGAQQLVNWFGYRFCYDSGGGWRSGEQDCPSPAPEGSAWSSIEQFPQDCMRAGIELGVHKAKLGSALDAARDGALNAVSKGGSIQHRCLAAVVGGLLWQGAASSAFEAALEALPSAGCQAAGLRALGKGSASACTDGEYHEQAACAAAEALQGNDGPVSSVLLPNAGDGADGSGGSWQASLYYSYMLYLATWDRYGKSQQPSWYPQVGPGFEAGAPAREAGSPAAEAAVPRYSEAGQLIPSDAGPGRSGSRPLDGGCGCGAAARPEPGQALALLLAPGALLLLVWRRRRG